MANEYDDIVSGMKQDDLRASIFAGARAQPDTEAKLQALSERVGLPVDAIRRNQPEVELHDRLKSFDYEKVIKESPKLSAWMADPKNSAVSHDDWENLSRTEKLLTYGRDYAGALGQGVVGQGAGSVLSGMSTLLDVGARSIDRPVRGLFGNKVADLFWYTPPRLGGLALDPLDALKQGGQGMKQLGNLMGPPKERQTLGTDVTSGVGQLGFQIGSYLLTGGASSTLQMFSQGADIMADKTAKDQADPALRDTAIVAGGAITALTEKYGLDKILNRVPPAIQNRVLRFIADKAAAGGIEAAQEFTEGLLHDIARYVLTNREAPILEGVDREMSAAALSAAIVRTALGVRGLRQARQQEEFFKALGEDAKASKLRERLPERYQELIARYTENGPVQQVMVPAERFTEYFQSVGIDPAQAASDFGATNYAEAVVAGSDIVIPMASFQANLAPTDHLQALVQDLRLAPDEMTIREARAAEANRSEIDQRLRDEVAKINEAAKSSEELDAAIRRVVTDVEGQLVARYDAQTARQMATVMRGLAVLAQRASPDEAPLQAAERLWTKYGLTIRANPLPDVLTQGPDFNAQIDPLLDRLRAGDVPSERAAMGVSLSEFIRDAGGLKASGETRDLDQSGERKPGQRKLVQPDGMDLDTALQRAIEAGYFSDARNPADLTIADFLEAMGEDLRGNRRFSTQNEDYKALNALRQLQALSEYIGEVGGDLATMDNAAIKALILPREVSAEFDQALPDQIEIDGVMRPTMNSEGRPIAATEDGLRNFWRWFGDSKVVDAQGRPLVVYHGTTGDITQFDASRRGENTGAESAGMGFFFTDDVVTAESYANYAATDARIAALLREAEAAEKRGDWDAYDAKVAEYEGLDASFNDPQNRLAGQNTLPVYLRSKKPLRANAKNENAVGFDISGSIRKAVRGKKDGIIIQNLDDAAGLANRPATHFVIFDPTQVKSAIGNDGTFDPKNPSVLRQGQRGSIQISPDRKIRINLFEKANLSTFLHESGHFYLEVLGDLAEQDGTSQQVKDDYAKILKFLGVTSRAEITVAHHEKWARANEAYLMEGKAPTPELRGVFQRFSAWLKLIYRQLNALNVELSDEVRGVMDRIYATDAEIARAEAEANLQALFLDAKAAGMTEAEFDLYRASVAEQTVEAKDALQQKLMRIERLKREAWWKEERAKVAEEVAVEFDAAPRAQAFQRLSLIDGGERMNRAQLVERYGEPVLKRLPRGYGEGRGSVYADDGQDIDALAEIMGFDSADAMIEALANMPNRARYIAAESDARMTERHGDLLNSVELADAATEALHNEQREKVLRMELRALNRKIREVAPFVRAERDKARQQRRDAVAATDMPPVESFRAIARGVVGQKQVRDLSPILYLQAERKASRAAFEAMAKGDYAEAQVQKQRELLNHYMYLEATRARDRTEKIRRHMDQLGEAKRRAKLAKAGADYLEQIDGIRERYEFTRVTNRQLARRESLSAWLAQQEAEGNAVAVPLEVQDDARRINWRQATVDELDAVYDAVRNIEHLANLKTKLIRKHKAIEFETVVSEMLAALDASGLKSTGDLGRTNMKSAGAREKGASMWRKFDAAHLKVEQLVEWLDGGQIDGPWARYLFDLADDAQTTEYDLHAQVTQKIEALSASMPKEWRAGLMDRTAVKLRGFDQPMTRYDLISIALNMGNAQNLQRLWDGYNWSNDDLQRVRDALTLDDWKFVQGTWDAIETLWPHMAALEERTSGLPPEKVEAVEFDAAGQTWRGGYFPLVYDPRKSNAGEKQANEAESVQNFMAQGYGRAATNRGATKQRVEKLKAPVLLDYEQVVTSHLAKVIKDISHREAVIGINKILTQPDIKSGLIDRVGEAQYEELRKWLQVLVNDRADTLHQASGLGGLVMKARTNMAIVTMGWKISTMLSQFAGLGPSLDLVKPQFFTKALIQSAGSPRETWALISQKSGEMRNRANTIERDARDALLRMRGERGMTADVRRTAFYLTAMADRMISMPTWLGAYQQALAEGKGEEDAIRAGDRAVRLSQGAGGSKDLAAVQRNNELMKLLTMYYTPFNVLYARLRDVGHQTADQGIGYLPKAAARLLALVVLPAVMGEILAGRGPDDDEDKVWWAIRKILLYPVATIPVLRDFAGYLEAGIIKASGEGEMKYPPSYKLSPVMGAIEKVARLPGKIADAVTGEKEPDAVAWDVFETSGYVFGLPTAQVRISGEYLVDLLSGNADPENAAELMRDAVFKRQN